MPVPPQSPGPYGQQPGGWTPSGPPSNPSGQRAQPGSYGPSSGGFSPGGPPPGPAGYGPGPGFDRTERLNQSAAAEPTQQFSVPGFGSDGGGEGFDDEPKKSRTPWILGGLGGLAAIILVIALVVAFSGDDEKNTAVASPSTVTTSSADPTSSTSPSTSATTTKKSSGGASGADTPKSVAQAFVNAANARDLAGAKNVVCAADAATMTNTQRAGGGSLSLGQVTQDSDSRATANLIINATIQGQNRTATLPFAMIRENGAWKLCPSAAKAPGT